MLRLDMDGRLYGISESGRVLRTSAAVAPPRRAVATESCMWLGRHTSGTPASLRCAGGCHQTHPSSPAISETSRPVMRVSSQTRHTAVRVAAAIHVASGHGRAALRNL